MSEIFKDFDAAKVLLWVVPGAFITLFRSFAIRGSFPTISKDDAATFVLGSVIYYFVLGSFAIGMNFSAELLKSYFSPWGLFGVIIVIPALAGMALGLLEASDAIGRTLRKIGIRLPSPDATAWETMFREMSGGSILTVTLKDGTQVTGKWTGGKGGSASSSDAKIMDLYLGEIGHINRHGTYVPHPRRRGAYLAASEIRFIEVVPSR